MRISNVKLVVQEFDNVKFTNSLFDISGIWRFSLAYPYWRDRQYFTLSYSEVSKSGKGIAIQTEIYVLAIRKLGGWKLPDARCFIQASAGRNQFLLATSWSASIEPELGSPTLPVILPTSAAMKVMKFDIAQSTYRVLDQRPLLDYERRKWLWLWQQFNPYPDGQSRFPWEDAAFKGEPIIGLASAGFKPRFGRKSV